MRSHCTQMNVIFFDSIDINATYIASRPHEIFDYTFKITPLPHIGDTSILSMKLQAIDSLPNGCDILFKGYCMEFLTGPEPIYDKVDIGDVFDMKIRFVPAPVRDGHRIVFILSDIDRANIRNGSYQLIPLKLIFDNDGTLRYVSQSGFPGLTDDRLPDAFPPEENKGDLTKTLKLYRKH
ncbi:MAG: hypothetical protein CVT49_13760 [candidate division Zixibacteria bacterium HGW-Zixibacteria-1]|nr:MAG: hypothetical protein CVT49_13760 [candidate division Zixibacteria bacterium HGW-Zixibacteria-1]